MGGYDLNGRYYPNSEDAINAEIVQCNEIDNRYNQRRLDNVQKDLQRNEQVYSQYIEALHWEIEQLKQPLKSWAMITESH